nr:ABC transporter ATP-binding protein [Actinomycetota bacterium]
MTMGRGHGGGSAYRQLTADRSVIGRRLLPGTARRVAGYGRPFRRDIVVFLVLTVIGASLVAATPLLLGRIIDEGVVPGD